MKKQMLIFIVLFSALRISAQTPGCVDSSFGGAGYVTTHIFDLDNQGNAVELQSDGKILVAGSAKNDTLTSFALIRYNADGTLDPSFGTGGIATPYFGNVTNVANALTIQSDQKIIAGGYARTGTKTSFCLARYEANGILDPSFGTGGIISTPLGLYDSKVNSVAIQQDGKIIAGGYAYYTSNSFVMVRYKTNGSIDSTFGINGVSVSMPGEYEAMINAIKLLSNGKILAVGKSLVASKDVFALARYNSNGMIDSTFGINGYRVQDINHLGNMGYAADIQPDGKILMAGNTFNGSCWVFAVMRFNDNGSLDTLFGNKGIDTLKIGQKGGEAYGVKVQNNGKIVVTGYSTTNLGNYTFATIRLKPDGAIDSAFGNAGVVISSLSNDDGAYSLALQPDGKIVVVGVSKNSIAYYYDVTLFRYFGDATPIGINEIISGDGFGLYPNPAGITISIESSSHGSGNSTVSIYDIRGNLVIEASLKADITKLDIHKLSKGLYIAKINKGENIRMIKFIKE